MHLLLAFALTLFIAVLISARAERTVLSTAVLFLLSGILLGRGALNFIQIAPQSPLIYYVAEIALFAVLFTDGMRTSPEHLRQGGWILPSRALLLGLPLTVLGTAVLAHYMAALGWTESLLLGAVLSPTDPVFAAAMFRFDFVPDRLQRLLNIESGLNDGLALPIIIFLLARMGSAAESPLRSIGEMAFGVLIGAVIPWIFVRTVRLPFFASSDLYRPLAAVSIALLIYGVSETLHGNLFLAAFSGSFVLGAISERATSAFRGFGELVAELLKLLALMVFGSLLTMQVFADLGWTAILFCVLALVIVRPAALFIALFGSGLARREWIAAAWFGPKGFASVVYSLLILRAGFPQAHHITHLVAVIITLSIIAHSSTDIIVARWFEESETAAPDGTPLQHASETHLPEPRRRVS